MNPQIPIEEMLRILNSLHAERSVQVDGKTVADAIANLNSLAQQGNEDAIRALIHSGNNIASSLFILWVGPKSEELKSLLRRIAAQEDSFPVSYHSSKVHNLGWERMMLELKVGSAGPLRTDGNQRKSSDVVDAVIDAAIQTIAVLKNRPGDRPAEVVGLPDLVAANADILAERIVQMLQQSDPEFERLISGARPFSTLGRQFGKRKSRREGILRQKKAKADPSDFVAQTWLEHEEKALGKMKQSVKDIRADFKEAIASRLKTRLVPHPKNTA